MNLLAATAILTLTLAAPAQPGTAAYWGWHPAESQLHTEYFRLTEMRGDPRETIYFVPSGWEAGRRWPLVVAFPGGLGVAHELVAEQLRLFSLAERRGFLVLVPSSTMNYSSVLPSGVGLQDIHDAYVTAAIEMARERYGADPERIFVIGFSAGGSGVWSFARRHPKEVRALAMIAPGGSPEREGLAEVAHLPILLAQAADDHAIDRRGNRRAVDALREMGARVRFEEFVHGSHGLTEYPVLDWAFDWFLAAGKAPSGENGGSGRPAADPGLGVPVERFVRESSR